MTGIDAQELLHGMTAAAIDSVSPQNTVPSALTTLKGTNGRTLVICMGKAAAQMAEVTEQTLLKTLGKDNFSGLVVTKHGNHLPLNHLQVLTAGHPEADEASTVAAKRILAETAKLKPADRLLVLISGGASALTLLPADGLSFAAVTEVNRELLRGGVPITEMNIVRRHISAFNGGRLARAANGAEITTFAVSDVPDDRPEIIGSGPTAPDASTFADARRVRETYKLSFPQSILDHLAIGADESVKPDNPIWHNKYHFAVIASNRHALEAAASYAQQKNVTPIIIPAPIANDAAKEAEQFAAIARTRTYNGKIIDGPAVLIRGGEAVVKLPKGFEGKGGRIGHAALSYLIHDPDRHAAFIATDGCDGNSGHSAIYLCPDSMRDAQQRGLDPVLALKEFRSAAFFDALEAADPEKPTGTNVNEIYMAFLP